MARPREFDTEAALNGAMNVFWALGYDGASLPDLLTGMGISRGSLYKAFTDKKTLFLTVLEHYEADQVAMAVTALTDKTTPDGMDRIRAVFGNVVAIARGGDRRGCLLCTAAAGPANDDPDISAAVARLLDQMEQGFRAALDDAPLLNDRDDAARATMAQLLLTQYVGLRILTRSQAPVETIEQSVTALSAMLSPQAGSGS